MAFFVALVSLPSAAWVLLVLAFAWLAGAIYAGIATGWLRATREAPSPARIVARACIIASVITYTIAAISVAAGGGEAAQYLENVVNQEARQGWEFYRVDNIGVELRPGCLFALFGQKATYTNYYVVTFRREAPSST